MYNDFIEKYAKDLGSYNTILLPEFQDNLTNKFEKFVENANKYADDPEVGPALGSHIDEYRAIHDSILHTYSILTRAAKSADDISLTRGTNASIKMQSRADEICAKVRYLNREMGKWEDAYAKIDAINSRDESKELFEDYLSKEAFLSDEYLNIIFAEEDVNKSFNSLSDVVDVFRYNFDIAALKEESPISAPMLDQIIGETEAVENDLIQSKRNIDVAIDKMQETQDRYRVNYFNAITNVAKYGMASLSGSTLTLAQNVYHKASDALSSTYKGAAAVYDKINRSTEVALTRASLLLDEYLNIASHGLYAKANIAALKSINAFKEEPKESLKKTADAVKHLIESKVLDEHRIVFEYPEPIYNKTKEMPVNDEYVTSQEIYEEGTPQSIGRNSLNINYWENLDSIFEQKVEKPLDNIVDGIEDKLKAAGKAIRDVKDPIIETANKKFDEIILYPCFDRIDKTDALFDKMMTTVMDAKATSTELLAKATEAIVKLDSYYYTRMSTKAKALHDADKKLHEKKEAINQVISALDDNIITPYVPKEYTESEEYKAILSNINNTQSLSESELQQMAEQIKTSTNALRAKTEMQNIAGQLKSDLQGPVNTIRQMFNKANLAKTEAFITMSETYNKAFDSLKGAVVNNIKLKEDIAKTLHNDALKTDMKAQAHKEDKVQENNIELD